MQDGCTSVLMLFFRPEASLLAAGINEDKLPARREPLRVVKLEETLAVFPRSSGLSRCSAVMAEDRIAAKASAFTSRRAWRQACSRGRGKRRRNDRPNMLREPLSPRAPANLNLRPCSLVKLSPWAVAKSTPQSRELWGAWLKSSVTPQPFEHFGAG